MRRFRVAAMLTVSSLTACAQLLSYDEYQPAPPSVDASVPLDVAVEAAIDSGPEAPIVEAARVPPRPTKSATASGTGKTLWLAVRRFRLGTIDLDRSGKDDIAWQPIGYDLDGRCTTTEDSIANIGTCIRPAAAEKTSLVDGNECRDNNFGHHIGLLLRSTAPDTELTLNTRVEAGQRTWVLAIEDVDVGDDGYAPARLWSVRDERPTGVKMLWDGSDVRMAADEGVSDHTLDKPLVVFPKGYISGDTWVSGEDDDTTVLLPMSNDYLIPMHLQHASMTIDLDADRSNGHGGTLAGAFDQPAMEAMIQELVRYAGSCPGSFLYMTALESSLKAFDLSIGAPGLQDPTKPCDSLSVGIGVDVRTVQPLAAVAPPRKPSVDMCAPMDAGTSD